jgi:peptide chain release factor 1
MELMEKLKEVEERFDFLTEQLGKPEVIAAQANFRGIARERSGLVELVEAIREYRGVETQLEQNQTLLDDADKEIADLAQIGRASCRERV